MQKATWITTDQNTHTWVYDNAGYVQYITVETDGSRYRLKLVREANLMGCNLLTLVGTPPANCLSKLTPAVLENDRRGQKYGADLRLVANALGLEWVGFADLEEPLHEFFLS